LIGHDRALLAIQRDQGFAGINFGDLASERNHDDAVERCVRSVVADDLCRASLLDSTTDRRIEGDQTLPPRGRIADQSFAPLFCVRFALAVAGHFAYRAMRLFGDLSASARAAFSTFSAAYSSTTNQVATPPRYWVS
jgi:hypothetical protein